MLIWVTARAIGYPTLRALIKPIPFVNSDNTNRITGARLPNFTVLKKPLFSVNTSMMTKGRTTHMVLLRYELYSVE